MNFTIPSSKRDDILISPSNKGLLNVKTSNKKKTKQTVEKYKKEIITYFIAKLEHLLKLTNQSSILFFHKTNRRKIQKGNNHLFHCKTGTFVKVNKSK